MYSYPRWVSKFKTNKGSWVFVPSTDSVNSGKRIKLAIEDFWQPPNYYYHLRKGGHVSAIRAHCQNTSFAHLDIENFFGSINKSRITRTLKKYFSYEEARCIARESTVKHPDIFPAKYILPFGFVQSSIIASICLFKSTLGQCINALASDKDLTISLYVDDIIISSNDIIKLDSSFLTIKDAAKRSKFNLNRNKEETPSIQISSFNINLSHNNIEIEPERFEQFESDFYNPSSTELQRGGYKNYIKTINQDQSKLLKYL